MENGALAGQLAELRAASGGGGDDVAGALRADLAALRAEALRLGEENARLQTTPKVGCLGLFFW